MRRTNETRALALAERMIDGGHLPIDALMTACRALDADTNVVVGRWVYGAMETL